MWMIRNRTAIKKSWRTGEYRIVESRMTSPPMESLMKQNINIKGGERYNIHTLQVGVQAELRVHRRGWS
jgi:hypothetical protein